MSKEAIEMIRKMDMEQVENQFVLQCAPLIAGLKMSNLFIIRKNHLRRLCALLQNSGIRCRVLYLDGDKLTVLLYNPAMLAIYMRNKRVTTILMENGYEQFDLESILLEFGRRYRSYRTENKSFPHELGLLLGYPIDDVEGFIKNDGKNCLYTGFWKVYANVPAKRNLFRRFECAREELMKQIRQGKKVEQVIACKR